MGLERWHSPLGWAGSCCRKIFAVTHLSQDPDDLAKQLSFTSDFDVEQFVMSSSLSLDIHRFLRQRLPHTEAIFLQDDP